MSKLIIIQQLFLEIFHQLKYKLDSLGFPYILHRIELRVSSTAHNTFKHIIKENLHQASLLHIKICPEELAILQFYPCIIHAVYFKLTSECQQSGSETIGPETIRLYRWRNFNRRVNLSKFRPPPPFPFSFLFLLKHQINVNLRNLNALA